MSPPLCCWTCTEAAQTWFEIGTGDCQVCRNWDKLKDKADWSAIATNRDGSPTSPYRRQQEWQSMLERTCQRCGAHKASATHAMCCGQVEADNAVTRLLESVFPEGVTIDI